MKRGDDDGLAWDEDSTGGQERMAWGQNSRAEPQSGVGAGGRERTREYPSGVWTQRWGGSPKGEAGSFGGALRAVLTMVT